MLIPRKKRCSKCGELKPCTSEYFHKHKGGKWGYRANCKECKNKTNKQYYNENKEYLNEKHKQYNIEHKEKREEYMKQYREEHKEELKEKSKQYREEHKEEKKEYDKQYLQTEQGKLVNRRKEHNKRAKLNKSEGTYTNEQWIEMMQYFDYKCAYSGEELIEGENYSIDHILAMDNGGSNYIWNLCPMVRNYNNSKKDNLILEWYEQQEYYSKERLLKIYKWIEYAYNKWGNK